MCGILAIFCNSKPESYDAILQAGKYLEKRGPDHSVDLISDNGMYLFRRLAINDTSDNGDQPMVDKEKGIVMMCNGEIYNHKELEKEFDIVCESGSDCEIILRLYEKIGFEETIKRLDGVYAIVLAHENEVYLARDPIGVRPLYLGITIDNFLAVSSVPNCLSYCTRIEQFPPGMCGKHDKLQFQEDHKTIMKCLFRKKIEFSENRIQQDILVPKIKETLVNAVKKRLMTDRPIGCLLSGGLDSSVITAILVNLLGAKNVRTYSIGMEGSVDLRYARKVAEYLGTDHHEVLFTPEEGFNVIPEIVETLGTHDITTIRASVGMYLVSKYITENTQDRVIFSGEGSDELMCGYLYFHNAPSPVEAENESLRLIRQLHHYDVLRADRTVSANGLELRVPFLDKDFLSLVMSISAIDKAPSNGIEKRLLREAFSDMLPSEVVNRRKDGFSDGVSSTTKSWYMYIQEFVDSKIGDDIYDPEKFISKEAMYYRLLFEKHFKSLRIENTYWMPKWVDSKDPSGRLINVYDEE